MKRIGNSHKAMLGHDHESIQMEPDCTLAEDCNSFEMCRMMVRNDQLLCIAASTNSQIYTRDLAGQSPWLGEESGIVVETILHTLLLFL